MFGIAAYGAAYNHAICKSGRLCYLSDEPRFPGDSVFGDSVGQVWAERITGSNDSFQMTIGHLSTWVNIDITVNIC